MFGLFHWLCNKFCLVCVSLPSLIVKREWVQTRPSLFPYLGSSPLRPPPTLALRLSTFGGLLSVLSITRGPFNCSSNFFLASFKLSFQRKFLTKEENWSIANGLKLTKFTSSCPWIFSNCNLVAGFCILGELCFSSAPLTITPVFLLDFPPSAERITDLSSLTREVFEKSVRSCPSSLWTSTAMGIFLLTFLSSVWSLF